MTCIFILRCKKCLDLGILEHSLKFSKVSEPSLEVKGRTAPTSKRSGRGWLKEELFTNGDAITLVVRDLR